MADRINAGDTQNQERQSGRQTGSGAQDTGDETQRRRNLKMEKVEREMPRAHPEQDPAKKKTGEF